MLSASRIMFTCGVCTSLLVECAERVGRFPIHCLNAQSRMLSYVATRVPVLVFRNERKPLGWVGSNYDAYSVVIMQNAKKFIGIKFSLEINESFRSAFHGVASFSYHGLHLPNHTSHVDQLLASWRHKFTSQYP